MFQVCARVCVQVHLWGGGGVRVTVPVGVCLRATPRPPTAATPSTCEALGVNDDPLHRVEAALFFLLLQTQGDLLGCVLEGTGEGSE